MRAFTFTFVKRAVFALTAVAAALFVTYAGTLLLQRLPTASAAGTTLTGCAWSGTVGWICMSGSNYGVTINADNTLSGYAWGDHVGWVSFNAADVSSCGAGPTIDPTTGALSGWAKALNGVGSDGCISLSSANGGSSYAYGVVLDGTPTYAWASDTIGWLDFEHVGYSPTLAITANGAAVGVSIPSGSQAYIQWSSSGVEAGSCSVSNNYNSTVWTANNNTDTSHTTAVLTYPTSVIYTLNCTDYSGAAASAQVTVSTNQPPAGTVSLFSANPSRVQPGGQQTTLTWTLSGMGGDTTGTCGITRSDGSTLLPQSTANATDGTHTTTDTVTQATTYTLSCTDAYGNHASAQVTVGLVPQYQEL